MERDLGPPAHPRRLGGASPHGAPLRRHRGPGGAAAGRAVLVGPRSGRGARAAPGLPRRPGRSGVSGPRLHRRGGGRPPGGRLPAGSRQRRSDRAAGAERTRPPGGGRRGGVHGADAEPRDVWEAWVTAAGLWWSRGSRSAGHAWWWRPTRTRCRARMRRRGLSASRSCLSSHSPGCSPDSHLPDDGRARRRPGEVAAGVSARGGRGWWAAASGAPVQERSGSGADEPDGGFSWARRAGRRGWLRWCGRRRR
jgi:hypothetical protein